MLKSAIGTPNLLKYPFIYAAILVFKRSKPKHASSHTITIVLLIQARQLCYPIFFSSYTGNENLHKLHQFFSREITAKTRAATAVLPSFFATVPVDWSHLDCPTFLLLSTTRHIHQRDGNIWRVSLKKNGKKQKSNTKLTCFSPSSSSYIFILQQKIIKIFFVLEELGGCIWAEFWHIIDVDMNVFFLLCN